MATPFNIIAQLQLQAPANLNTIVTSIQSRLSSITATINLTISPTTITALGALTGQLNALNTILATINTSAAAAAAALGPLGGSLSRVHSGTQQINSALVQTTPQFNQIATATRNATGLLENFGIQAGLAARRYSAFLLAGGAIVGFVNELRNAVGEAVSFQREMTRLAQVGNDTSSSLKDIEGTITRLSVNLGVSSKDLLGVSLQLRQAGLNASDTKIALDALAKSALAPNFGSLTDTTEGLISAMSQFKLTANDAEKTLGAINAVSTQYAVSSKDIIDAIRRTGGAFHAAGGSLNELIALFGAVRSTSRESAESIGSSLRTILVRTQRSDFIEDMHRLGIELRYTREEATRLGSVNLANQFVGPYEAVRRLSEGVKGLRSTDPRFAGISTELGGYRQISKTVPLLQEFAKAQEIYKTAQSGSNSLTKSAEEAQGAFLVKITKVKEEFSALIRTVTDSKGFQVFLDIVLQITSGLNKLAGALTPLIPLLAGLAAFQLARGTGRILGGFLAGATGQSPRFATGGIVPGSGDGDTVPAMLEPGEFVIRKQAAHRLGYDTLRRINTRGYAAGGKIPISLREGQSVGQLAISGIPKIVESSYDLEQVPESPGNPFRHTIEAYAANSYKYDHDKAFARVKKLNPLLENSLVEKIVKEDKGTFKSYVQNIIKKYEAKASIHNMAMQDKHDLDSTNKGTSPLWQPIAKGVETGIENITHKTMKSSPLADKNFTDSVSGFLLEGIVSAHTGLAPGGGKASVDFRDIRGSIRQLRKIIKLPSNIVPNNIDTKANFTNPGSIVLKALSANLFDARPILQDIQEKAIQLPGAEQVIGGRKANVEALHVISGNVRNKPYAHGGDVDDELPIHQKLQQHDPTFAFFTAGKENEPVTSPIPAGLIPQALTWSATEHGPILKHPQLGKYILPGQAKSYSNIPKEYREQETTLATGDNVVHADPVYMITPGSPQHGGDKIVNIAVSGLKPGKYGISGDAINKLEAGKKTTVSGVVHSYVLSSQALDTFNNEFLGPINQAIDGVFKQKFATGHGKNLDYTLGSNELKTISGYMFERYVSGLFGAQRNPEGQGYFDYPGPFPSREGLDKILYPHGPVQGQEGDAKSSYTKERTNELVGKWLNKYRGIKFAEGGEITSRDIKRVLRELSTSTGIDFSKFVSSVKSKSHIPSKLHGENAGLYGLHKYDSKTGKSNISLNLGKIKDIEQLQATLAHELGHAVDYYIGEGTLESEYKGTEHNRYGRKYAKAKIAEHQREYNNVLTDKSAEYAYSTREGFANTFSKHLTGEDVRGFDRRVIEKVAKMTNSNYEEKDLGFLGNLARKPGILGGAARLFGYAQGGSSKGTDTVPALLTPGEFVINREAAQRIGYGRLHAINQEGVARFAKGGPVYMATGGKMARRADPLIDTLISETATATGTTVANLSSQTKVEAATEALAKLYEDDVANARRGLIASGKVADNLEATRMATEGVENNFRRLRENYLRPIAQGGRGLTLEQVQALGLGGAGGFGQSLRQRREATGPLPRAVPAWYHAEMVAGSAAIPAAIAEHRVAHGLTGGQELSALTKRQISAQALAENYDRMVKETSAELLATKQARSTVEADRLAVERAEALHRKLAEEAGLEVGTSGVRQQLGATADTGGAGYLTRGQRLRRGAARIGNRLYENRYTIAGTAVGTAAYYMGQSLEASAGTPQEAVASGEATQEAYVGKKAVAGGIQGAVTAGAIGFQLGGPWGAAIGGVIGGLAGFTQSLMKAKEEILKAANELAGRRFEAAVGGFERGNVGAVQDIQTQFRRRDELLTEKRQSFGYHYEHDYVPGLLGFEESDRQKKLRKEREESEWREVNAPFLAGEQRLLTGAATRYAQNLRGGRGSINELAQGSVAGQSIQSLIELVARGRGLGTGGEKVVRQELEQQMRVSRSQLTSVREGANVDAVTRDFELLVLSARNAASGLSDLARATKVTEDLFSGTVNAIQFRPPGEALEQLGGPNPQEFARSVKEIAAPFGERGAAFQSTALGLDEAQRRFSAGLPDMLKGYQINPLQSGEQLADALEKTIRGGKKSPEMDPIIDAMKSKLVNINEGKQIQELIANPDKLRKQIFGDLQQDVTRTGQELSRILEASANAFSAASARFQQQLAQIGKVIDEQAKLTGEAMQIRARGRAELGGTLGTLALNTPLANREYAYRAVQTRLTGQAGLGSAEAFDPVAIGRRQREVQDDILARREAIDRQPGIRGGPEWDAAVNKIHELEKVSGDLSQALQHLGQVSERNAAIEERLAVLRKDQESRTNIAEKYLTGDPAARTQMYRGRMYAETIAQGGDIQQMAPGAIKDLMSFVQTAGGMITRDKTGTQITYTDLIHRAFENTNIPGFGPTNVGKLEIARGVAQQARNADVGEGALGQEARNMRRMANRQFGMSAPGGENDVNVRLNANMERLNESVVELRKSIEAATQVPVAAGAATGGPVKYYGFGSAVFKPKGTDTVPAMLTPNEYVVNAKSAQANKALLEKINAAHGPVYLAEGGTHAHLLEEFHQKREDKTHPMPGTYDFLLKEFSEKKKIEERERKRSPLAKEWAKELEDIRKVNRQTETNRWWKAWKAQPLHGGPKPRIAVAGFNAERSDVKRTLGLHPHVHVDMGDMPLVTTSGYKRNPFGGFAATDIIDGHLPRNIEEAGKVAQRRNLYDPYSKDSMLALYNRSRRGGRGDVGSANALIDAAKRAQIGEAGATAGMAGYRRGMGMVHSGRHIAGLGGGQYDWSTTGRAATQRIEENLNFVKFPIEEDMKQRHHGADFRGFFDRLRLARGQGVASNPTVHPGNFSMVLDEHNNIVGRLIPGSDYVITRLDKFKNLSIGQQTKFTKSQLERMVIDGTATHLHGNWRISHMATGGIVHGSDNIPALLTPGEFVLNASAASSLGYNRLQALNTRYLQEGGPAGYDTGDRTQATSEPLGGVTTSRPSAVSPTGAGGNFGGDINRLSAAFTTFSTKVTEFANAVAKIPPSLAMTYNGNLNVNINGGEALAKIAEPLKDMVVTQATNAINHMISTRMGGEVPRLGGADVAAMNIEPEGINRAK